MDVGAWLRERGLGQYEQVFRDNDVDARVLPGLTAEDLKDIGVVSVGHRRLILQAIAGLSAPPTPGAPAPVTTETVTPKATAEPPQTERRQLTVRCSSTWSARPRSPPASTPRTCVRSSAATIAAAPA